MTLSPDGTLVALLRPDGISWNDYAAWQEKGRVERARRSTPSGFPTMRS